MMKFSDIGVNVMSSQKIFQVTQVSITEILNCEIEVLEFEAGVKTHYGENRYVIKIRHDGIECKFFTDSKLIKGALDQVPKECFPFTTTIKMQKFGTGNAKSYYFT